MGIVRCKKMSAHTPSAAPPYDHHVPTHVTPDTLGYHVVETALSPCGMVRGESRGPLGISDTPLSGIAGRKPARKNGALEKGDRNRNPTFIQVGSSRYCLPYLCITFRENSPVSSSSVQGRRFASRLACGWLSVAACTSKLELARPTISSPCPYLSTRR